jgi:hypothetical protein
MRRVLSEEVILSLLVLLLAGVSPNIFPAAQAGWAKMSVLAVHFLVPSIVLLVAAFSVAALRGHQRLARRIVLGAAAGVIATLGLEVVRATSFRLGGMPGDLPRLLGVLLTDRFMLGPSTVSDVLGYAYHFWNGACFGIVFAVVFGRKPLVWAIAYAELIGLGFLASPAVKAMGVGFMATGMPAMIVTVLLAHLAFGVTLGTLVRRWVRDVGWLLALPANIEAPEQGRATMRVDHRDDRV